MNRDAKLRALCAHDITARGASRERADQHGDRLDAAVLVVFEQAHALDQAAADPGLEYQRGAWPIAELLREGLEGRDDGLKEADHVGASDDGPLHRRAVKDDVRAERGHHRLDILGLQGAAEGMGLGHVRLQSDSIVLLTALPSAPEGGGIPAAKLCGHGGIGRARPHRLAGPFGRAAGRMVQLDHAAGPRPAVIHPRRCAHTETAPCEAPP